MICDNCKSDGVILHYCGKCTDGLDAAEKQAEDLKARNEILWNTHLADRETAELQANTIRDLHGEITLLKGELASLRAHVANTEAELAREKRIREECEDRLAQYNDIKMIRFMANESLSKRNAEIEAERNRCAEACEKVSNAMKAGGTGFMLLLFDLELRTEIADCAALKGGE